MNAGKKARNAASITNNTKIYGDMAGLGPRIGRTRAVYRHIQIKGSKAILALNGKTPAQQKLYLQQNKLLSVNPLGSGGVGKKTLLFTGSRSGYVA